MKGSKTSRPTTREESSYCVYRDKLYVFGGTRPGEPDLDDFWVLDLSKLKWSEVSGKGEYKRPRARSGGVMFGGGGGVYLYGGQVVEGESRLAGAVSTACFDRFDVETNTWKSLRVCGHNPGPLQETTALPLTGIDPTTTTSGGVAEPHSVLLVHGYCQGGWLLDTHDQREVAEAMGRRRMQNMASPYKRQLFRYDLRTEAWTELEMIGQSWVLPTAQAFAVELGDGELCIGTGYGLNTNSRKMSLDEMAKGLPPSRIEELRQHEAAQRAKVGGDEYYANLKPESHRDIFRVRVAPRFHRGGAIKSGGDTGAREDDRLGRGWAWDLHAKAKGASVMTQIYYGSPTLRIVLRLPEGDFWPRDDVGTVAPAGPSEDNNDSGAKGGGKGGCMFGRRVEVGRCAS